jgi:hypothetical protein
MRYLRAFRIRILDNIRNSKADTLGKRKPTDQEGKHVNRSERYLEHAVEQSR